MCTTLAHAKPLTKSEEKTLLFRPASSIPRASNRWQPASKNQKELAASLAVVSPSSTTSFLFCFCLFVSFFFVFLAEHKAKVHAAPNNGSRSICELHIIALSYHMSWEFAEQQPNYQSVPGDGDYYLFATPTPRTPLPTSPVIAQRNVK